MEPIVVFGAGLVLYCGYLAAMDTWRDWRRSRVKVRATVRAISHRRRSLCVAAGRAGAAAARWQVPAKGSA
ncbi:hypothetical protein AOG1_07530 [Geobacter sp. AOG1]|nr:hypothetical protein AOG1_07530 [Geobacter sp. AOG1]